MSGTGGAAQRLAARVRSLPVAHRLPELVLGVGVTAQLVIAIQLARGMWFDLDAWDYLLERGTVEGVDKGLFAPHAGHWSTVTILIYRLLFAFFGMRHYSPYVLVTVLSHIAICLVMWRLLVRMGVSRWTATATTWLILFLGAGAQGFIWDAAAPPALSLLLGVLALSLLVRRGFSTEAQVVASALLLVSMMCSGVGVGATCLVGVFLVLERGWRTGVLVTLVPMVAFVVWYLTAGRAGLETNVGALDLLRVPAFVWTGLTNSLTQATGIPGAGPAILIALVVVVLVARDVAPAVRHLALAGMVTAVVQLAMTALARIQLGMEAANASRYAYWELILMAPAVALCFVVLVRASNASPRRATVPVAVLLLLAYTATSIDQQRTYTAFQRGMSAPWKDFALGTVAAKDAGERILTRYPAGPLTGDVDVRLITTAPIRAALPKEKVSDQTRLNAENEFFVGVGPDTYDLFQPADIEFKSGFGSPFIKGPGCHTYAANSLSPTLVLPLGSAGNEIGVRSESTKITTQLRRDGKLGRTREWFVEPGDQHIASSAKDADLIVTFDRGGEFTICAN